MSLRPVIRFAKMADAPQLVSFLEQHWRADHIFVSNPELLEWQHRHPDAPSTELTFVIAEMALDDGTSSIVAALGYMPIRRFDPSTDFNEIALAIWKVREDAKVPGLGIQMLKKLQGMKPAMIYAIGTSEVVRPMYEALGYTVGALEHVALFSEGDSGKATPAKGVPLCARRPIGTKKSVVLRNIDLSIGPDRSKKIDTLAKSGAPRKSWTYLTNRYLKHPHFSYTLKSVVINGVLESIIIWRKVETPEGPILRIVDVIGTPESLSHCGAALRSELDSAACDYIDLMAWGVDMNLLVEGGFVSSKNDANLILPNYFAPFVSENIRIELAVKSQTKFSDQKIRLYRADSDQDRPAKPNELR